MKKRKTMYNTFNCIKILRNRPILLLHILLTETGYCLYIYIYYDHVFYKFVVKCYELLEKNISSKMYICIIYK